MKKKILSLVALCAVFLLAFADSSIGKCYFKGEEPPHSLSTGTTIIYYYEMSGSEQRGSTEYKKCKGDVWVIYRKASEVKRIQVETTGGSVQVCYDF